MRTRGASIVITLVLCAGAAFAQQRGAKQATPKPALQEDAHVWTAEQGEWQPLPDIFPEGGQIKLIEGDPAQGPARFYFKFPAGYGVPWHFHSPIERVYADSGTMLFETLDGKKARLTEGGYIGFPERAPHRASCVSDEDCLFYLSSSDVFDIHLIDEQGRVTRSWSAAGGAKQQQQQQAPPQ